MSVVPAPTPKGKLDAEWNGDPAFNDDSTSGSDTSPGGVTSTPNQKLSSTESDDQGNKANSGQLDGYPRLCAAGPQESKGSVGHPDACNPCAFYCFAARGCRNGGECSFCHLLHESKLQRRRAEWKMAQRSKRLARKQGAPFPDAEEDVQLQGNELDHKAAGGGPRGLHPSFAAEPATYLQADPPGAVAAGVRRDPAVSVPSAQAPFPRAMGSDGGPRREESAMQPVKVQLRVHWPPPRAYPSSLTPGLSSDAGFVGGGFTTQGSCKPPQVGAAARRVQVPARPPPTAQKPGRDAPATSLQRVQQQMLPGSSVFQYSPSHAVVGVGQLIEIRPPVGLAVSDAIFGISPELPLGVHLDPHTGLILGKPQVGTDGPTTYFVTACTSASKPGAQGRNPLDVSLHISQVSIDVVGVQASGYQTAAQAAARGAPAGSRGAAKAAALHQAGGAPGLAGRPTRGPPSRGEPAKVATGWPGMAHLDQDGFCAGG